MSGVLGSVVGGHVLKASKDSIFAISPHMDELSYMSTSFDLVFPAKMLKSELPSIYWCPVSEEAEAPK